MSPQRIQLSRAKGWRKPEGAIVVARPSKRGNPFKVGSTVYTPRPRGWTQDVIESRAAAVDLFRFWLNSDPDYVRGYGWHAREHHHIRTSLALGDLSGHDLACWCPLDQPCHADVLLELANGVG